jgi:hypothetical protein
MNRKVFFVLAVIFTAFITTLIYVTLHELGHSLVAAACGAHITEFSLIKARMSYAGASFTQMTEALFNAAGAILPLLAAAVSLFFYRRNTPGAVYHIAYLFFTLISTASVLAWVIIPTAALFSQSPTGDDVTKFLLSSGLPPLVVAAGALLIILLMLVWIFYKGLPSAFVQVIKTVQES